MWKAPQQSNRKILKFYKKTFRGRKRQYPIEDLSIRPQHHLNRMIVLRRRLSNADTIHSTRICFTADFRGLSEIMEWPIRNFRFIHAIRFVNKNISGKGEQFEDLSLILPGWAFAEETITDLIKSVRLYWTFIYIKNVQLLNYT